MKNRKLVACGDATIRPQFEAMLNSMGWEFDTEGDGIYWIACTAVNQTWCEGWIAGIMAEIGRQLVKTSNQCHGK